ncbi:MAG: hypothetical protein Q8P01_02520 [bacterium]|nr:hypothetical protein [bacterium]
MLTKLARELYRETWALFHSRGIAPEETSRIAVPGRPLAEDEMREVDELAEGRIQEWARGHGFPLYFISEHTRFGELDCPEGYVFIDPFDCTDEFSSGIAQMWFSPVMSCFDRDFNPIAACACDLLLGRIWTASPQEGVSFIQLPNAFWYETVHRQGPDTRTTFRAQTNKVRVATYLANPFYSSALLNPELLWKLHKQYPLFRFFAHGGSCVYPMIVGGTFSGYVMAMEPDSETSPGLAFMKIAGCPVVSVDPETGQYKEYRPDLDHPERRQDLLVAACNQGMLETILSEFVRPLLPLDLSRHKEDLRS